MKAQLQIRIAYILNSLFNKNDRSIILRTNGRLSNWEGAFEVL